MPTDPLTASRYPASTAAPNVPQDIQNAVSDLSINTIPRFATTAARDAAYTAYTNAGGTLANGRTCWTDDSGYWDRIGGAWVSRTNPSTLRLSSTVDASLTSTGHAFQIGPDTGLNLIVDQNEIIARNNGAIGSIGFGGGRLNTVGDPTSATDAATKGYVDGTSGLLSIFGGWTAYSGYHTPSWTLSPSGIVTLSGMVQRTGASFALGTGSPFQFATLPASLVPTAIVSPICYAGLGASVGTYPARAYVAANSTNLSLVGMDSGTGTMTQTVGFINLDGVTFHV